ncbi:MAG: hypothetical protein II462_07810, partial [Muribaculaceae bacterium]|nr:hypothetical protein [Muribaculaceae bacterium]
MKLFLKVFTCTLLTTVSINAWSVNPNPEAPTATTSNTLPKIEPARVHQVSDLLDYAKKFRG